ncbi:MAG: hypothetical protein PVH99_10375 [Desulfobacteraceae bacterium]|jgi:hypothetical protein
MIPVRVAFDAEPHARDFNVKWTPTIVTLDSSGREHHRTLGFLAPEDVIASLLLGMGKVHFDADKFDDALVNLDSVTADYSKTNSAPEAIFFRGVSGYKNSHDPKMLKEAYERLQAEYPDSEWTKRAYPYRLI